MGGKEFSWIFARIVSEFYQFFFFVDAARRHQMSPHDIMAVKWKALSFRSLISSQKLPVKFYSLSNYLWFNLFIGPGQALRATLKAKGITKRKPCFKRLIPTSVDVLLFNKVKSNTKAVFNIFQDLRSHVACFFALWNCTLACMSPRM